MADLMKPIRISNHARKRMAGRGATESEVIDAVRSEKWNPALENKMQVRKIFQYGKASPVNQKIYAFKTIHAIFADEENEIIVVTVMVYYGDKEKSS